MEIKLYNTDSPVNQLSKVLTHEQAYQVKFKNRGTCDVVEPVLYIKSEKYITSNYAYIEDFKRYYYITKKVIEPNNFYRLYLQTDVLMSYNNSIRKTSIHVTRKENSNLYGADIKTLSKRSYRVLPFAEKFSLQDFFILVTAKGGSYPNS